MVRKPTRTFFLAVLAVALLLPLAAQANLVTDPGFNIPLTPQSSLTVLTDDGKWLVNSGGSWTLSSETAVSAGGDDWLIQGCTLPSTCFGETWQVRLSFDLLNTGSGKVKIVGFTSGQAWSTVDGTTAGTPVTTITLPNHGSLTPYQTSFSLPAGSENFVALGVGFNLPEAASVSMTVDNVVMDLVAPVNLKITPTNLNLKSHGNWVTAFISNPPSCETLKNINTDPSTLLLHYGENSIPAVKVNNHGNKFMLKFDRAALINMLSAVTAPADVTLSVTGVFDDEIAFEGTTSLHVIKPGKGPKK